MKQVKEGDKREIFGVKYVAAKRDDGKLFFINDSAKYNEPWFVKGA